MSGVVACAERRSKDGGEPAAADVVGAVVGCDAEEGVDGLFRVLRGMAFPRCHLALHSSEATAADIPAEGFQVCAQEFHSTVGREYRYLVTAQ